VRTAVSGALLGTGLLAAGLVLGSCGGSSAPPVTTSSTPSTSSTSAPSTTAPGAPSTTGPTVSTTTTGPPLSIAAFYSPTGNINCEMPVSGIDHVFCETGDPPRTVQMAPDGSLVLGTSIGNAGAGVPVLPYGASTRVAGVTCTSLTTGVTCTVAGGKGFTISRTGIVPVG